MFKRTVAAGLVLSLAILSGAPAQQAPNSALSGIYTIAQAARGQALYSTLCVECHGQDGAGVRRPGLQNAPPAAGEGFLRRWDDRTMAQLFSYVRFTMPQDRPRSRSDQDYIDMVAYMLQLTGIPAGDEELPPDRRVLDRLVIQGP